jgi:hypothetical protein
MRVSNAAFRDLFNAKLNSEIRIVSDNIGKVSRKPENKIYCLNNTITSVRECMAERVNARVVQTRKEIDWQGQEITAATSSLLPTIKEHKEQVAVTIDNLRQEVSKSKEYTDSKFSTVSTHIQDI